MGFIDWADPEHQKAFLDLVKRGHKEAALAYAKTHMMKEPIAVDGTLRQESDQQQYQKCEYCGKVFYTLREECNNCGAPLPLPQLLPQPSPCDYNTPAPTCRIDDAINPSGELMQHVAASMQEDLDRMMWGPVLKKHLVIKSSAKPIP